MWPEHGYSALIWESGHHRAVIIDYDELRPKQARIACVARHCFFGVALVAALLGLPVGDDPQGDWFATLTPEERKAVIQALCSTPKYRTTCHPAFVAPEAPQGPSERDGSSEPQPTGSQP